VKVKVGSGDDDGDGLGDGPRVGGSVASKTDVPVMTGEACPGFPPQASKAAASKVNNPTHRIGVIVKRL
jgi:hypothetical protein